MFQVQGKQDSKLSLHSLLIKKDTMNVSVDYGNRCNSGKVSYRIYSPHACARGKVIGLWLLSLLHWHENHHFG